MKKSVVPAGILRATASNLEALTKNPYPGRGIVVGLDDSGKFLVQVYWIMGRSENSRNRIFSSEGGRLFTEAADPSKVKDPSLIIYNAMSETLYAGHPAHVVSNGKQTDDVYSSRAQGLYGAMKSWCYEPDAPNFTPRITAVTRWLPFEEMPIIEMSILRKSPWNDACDRHLYEFGDIGKGFGCCITTYSGDGNPLPAFQGEPYLLPLCGDANFIAGTYWNALDADNRVSLAVKFIPKNGPSEIVIVNKYSKAAVT